MLEVRVDLSRGVLAFGGTEVAIALDHADLPAEGDVVVEAVPIGKGRHVAHVRVPARGSSIAGRAWEAIVAAGHPQPIFAGLTGFVSGDPGERTGKAVQVMASGASSFVVVGDIQEDLTLCGQAATLLDPQAVYPSSLELRPATVQRLAASQRESAETLGVADKGSDIETPLARLLVARGSSVRGSTGAELTDGDVHTSTWRERPQPGAGQGEFVVMASPREVPIARVQVALLPSSLDAGGADAAPKTFYLVTPTQTFQASLPEGAAGHPGEAPPTRDPPLRVYELTFPHPVMASCLSLVLGDAYADNSRHPNVGLAEIVAYSEFDTPGATLGDVAAALSGPHGGAAADVLARAGAPALGAVGKAYGALDARGRARAIDVAVTSEHCEDAVPLLVEAFCHDGGEAGRKAREKLERCSGAGPMLAQQLRTDAASRECVAPMLASDRPRASPRAHRGRDGSDRRRGRKDAVGAARRVRRGARCDAHRGRWARLHADPRQERERRGWRSFARPAFT